MPEPLWTYSELDGTYVDAAGAPLADAARRDAIEAAIAALGLLLAGFTTRLAAGTLTLADWQVQVSQSLKAAHLAVGAVAYGGLAELSPARLGVLEGLIETQLSYLDAWSRAIATGEAPVSRGALLVRAGLYAEAPRGTFGEIVARQAALRGAAFEANQLHPADHCAGCVAATEAGWVRVGVLPPPGQRDCRSRCRCTLRYRTEAEHAAALARAS